MLVRVQDAEQVVALQHVELVEEQELDVAQVAVQDAEQGQAQDVVPVPVLGEVLVQERDAVQVVALGVAQVQAQIFLP